MSTLVLALGMARAGTPLKSIDVKLGKKPPGGCTNRASVDHCASGHNVLLTDSNGSADFGVLPRATYVVTISGADAANAQVTVSGAVAGKAGYDSENGLHSLTFAADGTRDVVVMVVSNKNAKPTPTQAPEKKRSGVLIKVEIIPPQNVEAEAAPLVPIANAINRSPLYGAWVVSSGDCPLIDKCAAEDANIFIRATKTGTTYTLSSSDVVDTVALGTITNVDPSKISDSEVGSLLGTPSIVDGKLTLAKPQFQQDLQVVQATSDKAAVDYTPVVIELLARRGITAVRSGFTSVQQSSKPGASVCSNGERYFIYSMTTTKNPNLITGFTRIGAKAAAFVADCPTRTTIPFGGEDRFQIPTTNQSLLLYAAFFPYLLPKFAWLKVGEANLAFSKVVDRDPDSDQIKEDVATNALQQSVDNMCNELRITWQLRNGNPDPSYAFPSPVPSVRDLINRTAFTPFSLPTAAPPSPKPVETDNGSTHLLSRVETATSSNAAGTGSSNPLDLASYVGPSPPPLLCNPPAAPNLLVAPR